MEIEDLVLNFKCGPEVDCTVREALRSVKDINLKIHLLSANCLHCSGSEAPEFAAIE